MTNSLIVWAHPEPSSFTATWAKASVEAAGNLGSVQTSDLYSMEFEPAERAALYQETGRFDPLRVQEARVAAGTLPPDLDGELAKIQAADLLVLHFPIWWFGPPAILKGWFDRALVHGALHTAFDRFDGGPCVGKRVLFCVSTGCSERQCGPDGNEGDLRMILWPLAQSFRYCGFEVLAPIAVHSVHSYHEPPERRDLEARLSDVIAGQTDVLAGIDTREVWPFNADDDFDGEGRLKPDAPSYSPFIRHA